MNAVKLEQNLPHIYADNAELLSEAIQKSYAEGVVALDTEFILRRTYYAQPALYQMQIGEQCYLVDPLAVKDLTTFKELLEDPSIVKVMHGCHADLQLFASHLKAHPKNIFDTQVAAAFVGFRYSIGYRNLVLEVLDIALDKSETLSNWLQRPLSVEQLHYAVLDTHYLLPLYKLFSKKLQELDRVAWFEEEMAGLSGIDQSANYYRRHEAAWKLDAQSLLRFQLLCEWREGQAKSRDLPRGWVVADTVLYDFAKTPDLKAILEKHPKIRPGCSKAMRKIAAHVNDVPRAEWPLPVARPLGQKERECLKHLQEQVRALAETFELPETLLGSKKMLSELIVSRRDKSGVPKKFLGWRDCVFGQSLAQQVCD